MLCLKSAAADSRLKEIYSVSAESYIFQEFPEVRRLLNAKSKQNFDFYFNTNKTNLVQLKKTYLIKL